MDNSQVIHVRFFDIEQPNLWSRESAVALAESIKKLNKAQVVLNFSKVETISRSYADQLYKEKQNLLQEGIILEFIHLSDTLEAVIQAVATTQDRPKRIKVELEPVYCKDVEELESLFV
jgi:GTPase SAR1 family protein